VVKPVGLSGSRGVIRANDAREVDEAFARIGALLARPQIRAARARLEDEILIEEYVDGAEFAVEGVLTGGALQVLALFDKPDPLTGPFFEETIYTTPSALPAATQARVFDHVERAASALGLRQGPLHAECRVTPAGDVYVLEVAARPIGGLCSRVLTFDRAAGWGPGKGAASLEAVLLLHAVGEDIRTIAREARGAAVMMVPIPRRGQLRAVSGEEAARSVDGVTEVRITAKIGQLLEPLPEAGSYLGFIFARGATASDAEAAVRAAHARLQFDIAREIPVG
jgi:biotin carboxylase